jgi:hypothetical protein
MVNLRSNYGIQCLPCQKPYSDFRKDREAGAECIYRAMGADWWDWKGGSRLLFWHWSLVHQGAAR